MDNDADNWVVKEVRKDYDKLEATRNGLIQVGWIRNVVEEPLEVQYKKSFRVQFMLAHIVSGSDTIFFGDGSTLDVVPNSLHLSNPYKKMQKVDISPGQHESYHVIIPPQFYDTLLSFGLVQPGVFLLPAPKNFDWKARLAILADELMACKAHKLPSFVGKLYGEICDVLTLSRGGGDADRADTMRSIADLLSQNHESRLPLPDIASRFGMTMRTLERRFTEFFGVSPKRYRIARRMEMAERLLRDVGNSNISEIAGLLGYSSPFAFSQQFKDHFGVSPSKYRCRKNVCDFVG